MHNNSWYFALLVQSLTFCTLVSQTALLVAVTANQPDIVQDLLYLEADISICDVNGQTALHLAATYGFPRVMQVKETRHMLMIQYRRSMHLKILCFK